MKSCLFLVLFLCGMWTLPNIWRHLIVLPTMQLWERSLWERKTVRGGKVQPGGREREKQDGKSFNRTSCSFYPLFIWSLRTNCRKNHLRSSSTYSTQHLEGTDVLKEKWGRCCFLVLLSLYFKSWWELPACESVWPHVTQPGAVVQSKTGSWGPQIPRQCHVIMVTAKLSVLHTDPLWKWHLTCLHYWPN